MGRMLSVGHRGGRRARAGAPAPWRERATHPARGWGRGAAIWQVEATRAREREAEGGRAPLVLELNSVSAKLKLPTAARSAADALSRLLKLLRMILPVWPAVDLVGRWRRRVGRGPGREAGWRRRPQLARPDIRSARQPSRDRLRAYTSISSP